jgi:hypothetical protein
MIQPGSLERCLYWFADNETKMIPEIDQVKERLRELEEEIAETKRRLPAHSVKPPVMMDLLELEDERDLLLKKLGEFK